MKGTTSGVSVCSVHSIYQRWHRFLNPFWLKESLTKPGGKTEHTPLLYRSTFFGSPHLWLLLSWACALWSMAARGIRTQVNGPLTPHQSLAWLIRQRSDSLPLRSTSAHQLPISARWYQCKAESRGKSKVGFRGLKTKKAQQLSPAVQMTHLQALRSLCGDTLRENTKALYSTCLEHNFYNYRITVSTNVRMYCIKCRHVSFNL